MRSALFRRGGDGVVVQGNEAATVSLCGTAAKPHSKATRRRWRRLRAASGARRSPAAALGRAAHGSVIQLDKGCPLAPPLRTSCFTSCLVRTRTLRLDATAPRPQQPNTSRPTTMRALLCFLLCLVAHASAGRITPAARAPAQRLRGNQQPRTMTHDDRRVPRSGRVSLVATRRRAGDDRAPKASNADCRGGPQRASRERMAEPPPRGADYHGCPRRRSGGTQCDTPSDTGSLACSF